MDYTETLEYIHRISWTGSRPGLERITELLGLLGNPQDSLRFIHVAGTNGKGSFCAICDSVLRASGYGNVGLYTSPYIERFNERIAFNGEPISDAELADITTRIRPLADSMADAPTEFELITAVAMVAFAEHKCDPVILEVGMGGRLDATNVIKKPLLSVITGISLDHTAILGATTAEIAAEKAGIIKNGTPVIMGGNDPCACEVIKNAANARGCPIHTVSRGDIANVSCSLDGTVFDFGERKQLRLGLLGAYQPYNAATVITAADLLNTLGFGISESALRNGLAAAKWKGRFELLSRDPLFIIDGSHNPEGISAAVESIKQCFGEKKVFVLSGVLRDKDYLQMAREITQVACRVFTIAPNNARALEAGLFAGAFRANGIPADGCDSIPQAVGAAVAAARIERVPLVALGSLYMYGDVKRAFYALG